MTERRYFCCRSLTSSDGLKAHGWRGYVIKDQVDYRNVTSCCEVNRVARNISSQLSLVIGVPGQSCCKVMFIVNWWASMPTMVTQDMISLVQTMSVTIKETSIKRALSYSRLQSMNSCRSYFRE